MWPAVELFGVACNLVPLFKSAYRRRRYPRPQQVCSDHSTPPPLRKQGCTPSACLSCARSQSSILSVAFCSVPEDYTPDAEAHHQVVEVKKKVHFNFSLGSNAIPMQTNRGCGSEVFAQSHHSARSQSSGMDRTRQPMLLCAVHNITARSDGLPNSQRRRCSRDVTWCQLTLIPLFPVHRAAARGCARSAGGASRRARTTAACAAAASCAW
jgi:hypothetical protein